jgi:hypothetical protein
VQPASVDSAPESTTTHTSFDVTAFDIKYLLGHTAQTEIRNVDAGEVVGVGA